MASTGSDINVLKGLEIPKRKAQFPLWSGELKHASLETQKRQVGLFTQVDPAYGEGVAKALGLS